MSLPEFLNHAAPSRGGRGAGRGPGDPFPATRDDDTAVKSGNGSRATGRKTVVVRGPHPAPRLPRLGVHAFRETRSARPGLPGS